jgi:hypothetical protein
MEHDFKGVAFGLGFNSAQIDAVYAALDLLGHERGYSMPLWILNWSYRQSLPTAFADWVKKNNNDFDYVYFPPHEFNPPPPHDPEDCPEF